MCTARLILVAVAACAATPAWAAQVQFFLASPQANNGATSGPAAYAARLNPRLPPGPASANVEFWAALNPQELAQIGLLAVSLGVSVQGPMPTSVGSLALWNPGGRWVATSVGYAGPLPNAVWPRFAMVREAPLPLPSADAFDGDVALFRLASGQIQYSRILSDLFLHFAHDGGVGTDHYLGVAGVAFGWAPDGTPDLTSYSADSDGQGTPGPLPNFDNQHPQYGWMGTNFGMQPVVSLVPDLYIAGEPAPEPATIGLLVLGLTGLPRLRWRTR